MHVDIADGPNEVFYKGHLPTNMRTSHERDQAANYMRRQNKELFNLERNMIVIDVAQGSQSQDPIGSSYSELNVKATMALVERLLGRFRYGEEEKPVSSEDITILTFYPAQERFYRLEMAQLNDCVPDLRADKVKISTVDRFGGEKSSIVILDLVVVGSNGFFNDPGRMCSALTRAKCAEYIITNFVATSNVIQRNREEYAFLCRLFERWEKVEAIKRPRWILRYLQSWAEKNKDPTLNPNARSGNSERNMGLGK